MDVLSRLTDPMQTGQDNWPSKCFDVARFLSLIHPTGYYEVRALKCPVWPGASKLGTKAGWFSDHGVAEEKILELQKLQPPAIFITANPVRSEMLALRHNRIADAQKTTADADIDRRTALFIDIDPERLSGVSATDAELSAANDLADQVAMFLRERGFPDPVYGSSGNGFYLIYRIDVANDDNNRLLIERCLAALSQRFNNDSAKVDTTASNAARLCKVLGTWARKGDHIVGIPGVEDRPHRQSWFIDHDEPLEVVPVELLEELANEAQEPAKDKPPKSIATTSARASDWLDNWLLDNHVPVENPTEYQGGRKWLFSSLPRPCESHGHSHDGSSCLIERPNGTIQATCHHENCNWKWKDLRRAYEPDAYEYKNRSTDGVSFAGVDAQPVGKKYSQASSKSEVLSQSPDTTPTIPGKSEVVSQTRESKSRKSQIPELHEFVPFPTSMLPKPLDEFVRQAAKSICCDESFVALPLLAGLASAIGNSYGLLIKRSWVVPSILWSVVVAESGTGKSAPQRLALRPIHARQKRLLKDYDKAWEQHLRDHEIYMRDLADFKKSKDAMKEPPEAPIEPVCPRVVCNDVTIEALAKRLKDNPRGILCATDELAGWFGGFNRYKGGKSGGEESKWLEFSNAQTSIVDRSSSPRPLVIDKASVGVTGTIQPGILRKHLTAEHKSSGMAARLLFAMPPRIQKRWVEDEIDEDVEDQVTDIFDALFKLEMRVCDDGSLDTNLIRLDSTAKQLFISFFNRHNREQHQLNGDLFAAFSKLEEYAARFALVIHCVRYAAGDVASLTLLDVNSMMAGIELCQWFKSEAKRVYSVLSECEVANENRKLLSWIHNNGGSTTPRDFHRAHRSVIDDSTAAETLLQQFVTAGYGEWEQIPPTDQGGRPTRKFSLTSLGQNLENSRDLGGCVPEVPETPDITEILGKAWKP